MIRTLECTLNPVDAVAKSPQPLAVFDLDGTLIRRDSFLPFVLGYARYRRKLIPLVTLPFWLGLYGSRLISDSNAKEKVLVSFFQGESLQNVSDFAKRFSIEWIRPRLYEQVNDRLVWHLASGHRVVLLSASPNLYVDAVGRELGISEVICTRVKATATGWNGALDGANCKGAEKLSRLLRHLGKDVWPAATYAYGDSNSDLPVLRWARHGYLVQRGGELRAIDLDTANRTGALAGC